MTGVGPVTGVIGVTGLIGVIRVGRTVGRTVGGLSGSTTGSRSVGLTIRRCTLIVSLAGSLTPRSVVNTSDTT